MLCYVVLPMLLVVSLCMYLLCMLDLVCSSVVDGHSQRREAGTVSYISNTQQQRKGEKNPWKVLNWSNLLLIIPSNVLSARF